MLQRSLRVAESIIKIASSGRLATACWPDGILKFAIRGARLVLARALRDQISASSHA